MGPEYVLNNFIIAAERLRKAQKLYYATKSYEPELKSKRYSEARAQEAQFDKAIEQGRKYLKSLPAEPKVNP